jgi:hypothetical protein
MNINLQSKSNIFVGPINHHKEVHLLLNFKYSINSFHIKYRKIFYRFLIIIIQVKRETIMRKIMQTNISTEFDLTYKTYFSETISQLIQSYLFTYHLLRGIYTYRNSN